MTTHPRFRDWFESHRGRVDGVVLDIDGVLLRDRRALPGAVELLDLLEERGCPFRLLTNDGCSSVEQKAAALAASGVSVKPGRITSSGHVLESVVRERGLAGRRFFVLGRLGTPCYARSAGLVVTRELAGLPNCDGVVVGECDYDWESTINAVINYFLKHPTNPFLVPNPDCYFPAGDSSIRLASGAVTFLIAGMLHKHSVTCSPEYLGKPHEPIYACGHELLEKEHGPIDHGRVVMVGDTIAGDIAGAQAFGYVGALVLTGVTSAEMLAAADPKPDLVFEAL